MIVQAVKWVGKTDGFLELIDQRKLPHKKTTLKCRDIKTVFDAIKTLAVRGAPAIGVAAAYGVVLGMQKVSGKKKISQAISVLKKSCEYLGSARPTAVNLFWALERVKQSGVKFLAKNPDASIESLRKVILNEANAIYAEDVEMCRRIGRNGAEIYKKRDGNFDALQRRRLSDGGSGNGTIGFVRGAQKGKEIQGLC